VLGREAYRRGRDLGADAREGADAAADGADVVLDVLEEQGFEPRSDDQCVSLVNCPFHDLARKHTELVCGMNLRLLEGVLDGVGDVGLSARLEPAPGHCCVRLGPTLPD
jgi:predicted ArsR family transcriptional regulator